MVRETWTDERLDDFRSHVDVRFDGVDRRFDEVDRRFEVVDERFDEVDDALAKIDGRFDKLEAKMERNFERIYFILAQAAVITIAALIGLLGLR